MTNATQNQRRKRERKKRRAGFFGIQEIIISEAFSLCRVENFMGLKVLQYLQPGPYFQANNNPAKCKKEEGGGSSGKAEQNIDRNKEFCSQK